MPWAGDVPFHPEWVENGAVHHRRRAHGEVRGAGAGSVHQTTGRGRGPHGRRAGRRRGPGARRPVRLSLGRRAGGDDPPRGHDLHARRAVHRELRVLPGRGRVPRPGRPLRRHRRGHRHRRVRRWAACPLGIPVQIEGATRPGTMVYSSWLAMAAAHETEPRRLRLQRLRARPPPPRRPRPGQPDACRTGAAPRASARTPIQPLAPVYSLATPACAAGSSCCSPSSASAWAPSPAAGRTRPTRSSPGIPGDSGRPDARRPRPGQRRARRPWSSRRSSAATASRTWPRRSRTHAVTACPACPRQGYGRLQPLAAPAPSVGPPVREPAMKPVTPDGFHLRVRDQAVGAELALPCCWP